MERHFRAFSTLTAAVAVFAMLVLASRHAAAVDFPSLLRNPDKFHGKRISVVGVVVGDGPEFELYRTAREARESVAPSQSLFVIARGAWHRNRPFDLHRVRVTGTVDAKRHGIWGNPCEISLERLEALSKGPVTTPKIPTCLFRNEHSEVISVRLFSAQSIQGAFEIGPGESVGLPLSDGEIKVFNLAGALLAEDSLGVHRRSRYYDRKHGAFYYRITGDRIEKVMPSAARRERQRWR